MHWSTGLICYFPTYCLGNMYAAQFYRAAEHALGDLDQQFSQGEFGNLKNWLNTNIHLRGKQYQAERLVEVVTGESLASGPLVQHLKQKYGPLYALDLS